MQRRRQSWVRLSTKRTLQIKQKKVAFNAVDVKQDHGITYTKSLLNVGYGNFDLGVMVNGSYRNPIKMKPFDVTLRRPNILGWCGKVGFLSMTHKKSMLYVGCGNLDLGGMVNGSSCGPIKMKPFDFTFRRPIIIGWCREVGFLPMTVQAAMDPKVRYRLGNGGAPEEEEKRLTLLKEAYF